MGRSTCRSPFSLVSCTLDMPRSECSINVYVLFAGTLADLKKHRAQSRFTQGAIINGNGSLTPSEVLAAATTNGGGSIVTATTTTTSTTNGYDDMDGNGKIPIELSLISAEDHYQSNNNNNSNGNITSISSGTTTTNGAINLANGSTKFSGIITGDVVGDSTRSKRCCVVM